MKGSLIIATLFAVVCATPAFGQRDPAAMKERLSAQKTEIIQLLKLSDEQLPLVSEILDRGIEQRSELMGNRSSDGFSGMREKMEKIDSKTTEDLSAVLSEKQMEIYAKKMKDDRENRPRRRPPNAGNRIN